MRLRGRQTSEREPWGPCWPSTSTPGQLRSDVGNYPQKAINHPIDSCLHRVEGRKAGSEFVLVQDCFAVRSIHRRGIKADPDALNARIREATKPHSQVYEFLNGTDWEVLHACNCAAPRVVASDECIRLRAVQQTKTYTPVHWMQYRSLAFNYIPMVRRSCRR